MSMLEMSRILAQQDGNIWTLPCTGLVDIWALRSTFISLLRPDLCPFRRWYVCLLCTMGLATSAILHALTASRKHPADYPHADIEPSGSYQPDLPLDTHWNTCLLSCIYGTESWIA